jgi:hypothetical protein
MKFKDSVPKESRKRILKQMLSLHKYSKSDDIYHTAILVLRSIYPVKVDIIASEFIPNFNRDVFDHKLDQINMTHKDYKQSKTGVVCAAFKFIEDKIKADELKYKMGSKQISISYAELQYYLFRLTNKLFKDGGYETIARNYFTCPGFKSEYKKRTGRSIYGHKIAHMNFLLNRHNLVKVYTKRKKINLYAIGTSNPYSHFQGIIEKPGDLIRLQADYQNRNLKTKDEMEIDKLKKLLKEKDAQIAENDDHVQKLEVYKDEYEKLQEMNNDLLTEKTEMANEIETLRMKIPSYMDLVF